MTTNEMGEKLQAGKNVYLYESYEDVIVKFTPEGKTFLKFKGKPEYEVDPKTSGIVQETKLQHTEKTAKDYASF